MNSEASIQKYINKKVKVAVLISGNGSNLQALIDACASGDYPAEIACVISNKPDAYGLQRAQKAGIENYVISHKDFSSKTKFEHVIDEKLKSANIEIICLAGFMRLLSSDFVDKWQGQIINIHPSLLPAYKGLDTHSRVIAAKEKETGATVHYVTAEMDAGEIILQQKILISPNDDANSLQQKVHKAEHVIYPQALQIVANKFMSMK